jgi:hypothetical protein
MRVFYLRWGVFRGECLGAGRPAAHRAAVVAADHSDAGSIAAQTALGIERAPRRGPITIGDILLGLRRESVFFRGAACIETRLRFAVVTRAAYRASSVRTNHADASPIWAQTTLGIKTSSLVFLIGCHVLVQFPDTSSDVRDHSWRKQGSHARQNLTAQQRQVMGDGGAGHAHDEGSIAQAVGTRMLAQEITAYLRVRGEHLLLLASLLAAYLGNHGGQ